MYSQKINAHPRERFRLAFNLQCKAIDAHGRFAGYASVFNVIDNQRDVVVRGAFKRTLYGRMRDIKFLWQHRQEEPIGAFDRIFEDMRGLYVEGKLLLNVRRAQEAHSLLKSKAISGLSIGYSPVRFHVDAKTGVRRLSQIDLWEISLVTFPANEAAGVTVIKSCEPQAAQNLARRIKILR